MLAGADLSVMTGYEGRFGVGTTLKLETTFRCPPSLCAVSSTFVRKNPKQIAKTVRSPKPEVADAVRILRVADARHSRAGVEARVAEIAADAASQGNKVTVFVLGRYNSDSFAMPATYDQRWVDVRFSTVHASKGREADHVIVVGMSTDGLGFPSRVVDDPVLQLAMPGGDDYPHAEERRLFYVAITRARATATLITVARKESTFVTELKREQNIEISNIDGSEDMTSLCPGCGKGYLTTKTSRFGRFIACTAYPRCEHKQRLPQERPASTRSRR